MHDQRKLSKNNNQWILYDPRYLNAGMIIYNNELHNIFLISERNMKIIGGKNTTNKFVFMDIKILV